MMRICPKTLTLMQGSWSQRAAVPKEGLARAGRRGVGAGILSSPAGASLHLSIQPQDVEHLFWVSASWLLEEVAYGCLPFPQKQNQG